MSEPKNSKDALEFIHTLDSLAIKKQQEEIERLCAWGRGLESDLSHARVEISFLKDEVERLRLSAFDKKVAIEAGCYARVNLEAKVERLIKAGDGMADAINGDYNYSLPCVEDWQAAKEGKPSV